MRTTVLLLALAACARSGAPPSSARSAPPAPTPTMAEARAAERGTAGPRDFARAASIYATLCDGGEGALDACFAFADDIIDAKGASSDPAQLLPLENTLCRRGDVVACMTSLWVEAMSGQRVRPEQQLEAELSTLTAKAEVACTRGDGRACEMLASMRGGDGSSAEEFRKQKYAAACRAGRLDACADVADELEECGEPEVDDAAKCEKRQLADWKSHAEDADELAAATTLLDACHAGEARGCDHIPSQRIPMAALCTAHDYGACGELGCLGDDAAAATARAHGVRNVNCYVAGKKALLEWRRMPGKSRSPYEPIVTDGRAPIGARTTPPFEAVHFEHHGGRDSHGWPRYDAYNLSNRAVTELAVCLYAYQDSEDDPDGPKQVARVAAVIPNVSIAPNTIISLRLDDLIGAKLPTETTDVVIDYDHVRFEGDAQGSDDASRCPAERPSANHAPDAW